MFIHIIKNNVNEIISVLEYIDYIYNKVRYVWENFKVWKYLQGK